MTSRVRHDAAATRDLSRSCAGDVANNESRERKAWRNERHQEQPPPVEDVIEEEELADKRDPKRKAKHPERTSHTSIRHAHLCRREPPLHDTRAVPQRDTTRNLRSAPIPSPMLARSPMPTKGGHTTSATVSRLEQQPAPRLRTGRKARYRVRSRRISPASAITR